jgi:hypothetical protein
MFMSPYGSVLAVGIQQKTLDAQKDALAARYHRKYGGAFAGMLKGRPIIWRDTSIPVVKNADQS